MAKTINTTPATEAEMDQILTIAVPHIICDDDLKSLRLMEYVPFKSEYIKETNLLNTPKDKKMLQVSILNVDEWYLVTPPLFDALNEQEELLIKNEHGCWWGCQYFGENDVRKNPILLQIVRKINLKNTV